MRQSYARCGILARCPPPLGKVPLEKRYQRPLFRRMRTTAIRGGAARARQRDRLTLVEIPRDHHWMHV
jgi:hypothetical protein